MINHIVAAYKRALGLHRPGRNLVIFPDDIFLVSFPKSGNTWTRFLLANLTHPEQPATFENIRRLLPDPTGTTKRELDRAKKPRIIKSHDCYDPRFPRVIYIVRDPRDVVVSQYHYHRKIKKIDDQYPKEKFVARFLAGETCPHGSWGQNVVTWLATSEGDPRFMLLRYEDMVADTAKELAKVVPFIGISATPELIAQAIERSSAGQMRKLEKEQSEKIGLTRGSRKDISFVRAAGSGGWHAELPTPLVEKIEAAWGPIMRHLGYELSTQVPSEARDYESLGIGLGSR